MGFFKKFQPAPPRAFFSQAAAAVRNPKAAVKIAVSNLQPANALKRILPPGVGAHLIHSIHVNLDNVKSKQACIKKNAVGLGVTGGTLGLTFGPWGGAIGAVGGAAVGAGTALAKKGCSIGVVVGDPSKEFQDTYTEPLPPGMKPAVVTSIEGEGDRPGGSGFLAQFNAFLKDLGLAA